MDCEVLSSVEQMTWDTPCFMSLSRVAAPPGACAPVSLENSFGVIRVFLPEAAGYAVEGRTSFGRIKSELPLAISMGQQHESVSGRIGDGKCALTLNDTNGNIELLKAKSN